MLSRGHRNNHHEWQWLMSVMEDFFSIGLHANRALAIYFYILGPKVSPSVALPFSWARG